MATSYSNPGGSGDRTSIIKVYAITVGGGSYSDLVNGVTNDNSFWFSSASGSIVEFWFSSQKIIDEAKFYQQIVSTHGDWKWQGSNDRITWTDIGGTFTLGTATLQTLTTLSGNTTAYVFYRIFQTSGSASPFTYVHEFEFKIDEGGTTSYANTLGSGDRTGLISITSSGISLGGGAITDILDGSLASEMWWGVAAAAGNWIVFDFGSAYIVQQARFIFNSTSNSGDWKFQGSADNSVWTDLSGTITLGLQVITCLGGFESNTNAYRYYRLLGVSGNRANTHYELEFEFMVASSVYTPPASSNERTSLSVSLG